MISLNDYKKHVQVLKIEQKIGRIQRELETVDYGDGCPLHEENDCADVRKAYDRGYVSGLYEAITLFELIEADTSLTEMMILEEAILHCEEVSTYSNGNCSDEHRQLAEWLKELKAYREVNTLLTDTKMTELAKVIVHKMIDESAIADDAYPDLRQRMHEVVERWDKRCSSDT